MAATMLEAVPHLDGERILEFGELFEHGAASMGRRLFGGWGKLEAVASTSKQLSESYW